MEKTKRFAVGLLIIALSIGAATAEPPVACGKKVHCVASQKGKRDTCEMLDGSRWIFDVSSPDKPQGEHTYTLTRVTALVLTGHIYYGECFYGDEAGGEFKAMTKYTHYVTAYYSDPDEWVQINTDELYCDPFNHPCLFTVVFRA